MKRKPFLSPFIAASLLCGACSADFQPSDNGKLDGYWQLTSVDTLATNRSADMAWRMLFWAVQGNLLELSDTHEGAPYVDNLPPILCRFERRGDTLIVKGSPAPRLDNREQADSELATAEQLRAYGLSGLSGCDDTLLIKRLDRSTMVLQSSRKRVGFKRF